MKTANRKKMQVELAAAALAWACWALPCAWATTGIDPTNKCAWTENTGWANAAPTNGGVTVYYNETNGYLTGLAWGENIGWIKLGNDAGGPYANTNATDWGVNLDTTGNLTGLAWGENVGWIKFNPSNSVVTIDKTTGRFTGDAWGENIGWVRFKGASPDYNVRTLAFEKQPQGTPNWWLANYAVAENYDAGDGVPAWQKYVMDAVPNVAGNYLRITAISNRPPITVTFPSSTHRYYTLQRRDDLQPGSWTNVATQTGIAGTIGLTSLQDVTATNRQFYRVEVKVTP